MIISFMNMEDFVTVDEIQFMEEMEYQGFLRHKH